MAMAQVDLIPFQSPFGLNYIYVMECDGVTAVIDPGHAQCVIDYCAANNKRIDLILLTHQDSDHIEGAQQLKQLYGAQVLGPKKAELIQDYVDRTLCENDSFMLGNSLFVVLETPGHTADHICFYSDDAQALFCGDCLFVLGCGRVRTSMQDMWNSLLKLRALSDDLRVYCGHEYTKGNIAYLESRMPLTHEQQGFVRLLNALLEARKPTIPSTLGQEKRCNPFLNADNPDFVRALGLEAGQAGLEAFTQLRKGKDNF